MKAQPDAGLDRRAEGAAVYGKVPGVAPAGYDLNAHRRMLASLALAFAVALAGQGLPSAMRFAAGWDAGAILFLALTYRVVRNTAPAAMQETVLAMDHGRAGILMLVLLASVASLCAIFVLVQRAAVLPLVPMALYILLAVATVMCSWALTHVMFALHYAHRYYRDDPAEPGLNATGGLRFPGGEEPHYWDFLYFSFVIGMTSQVSDVAVTSRAMRQLVLCHSVLSFVFYTVVLALCINIVAGLL